VILRGCVELPSPTFTTQYPPRVGIEHDDTLAEVVGFLEACQPRMVDLVEAGMQGMLGEDLLSLVFRINDDLIKTVSPWDPFSTLG
jgi:hypothetical protein